MGSYSKKKMIESELGNIRSSIWKSFLSGESIEFFLTKYSNLNLLIISKSKKFGNIIEVINEKASNPGSIPIYLVSTLLGRRCESRLSAYVKALADGLHIGCRNNRPLMVWLGFECLPIETMELTL